MTTKQPPKQKPVIDQTALRILRQLEKNHQNLDGKEARKYPRRHWCVVLSAEFDIEDGALSLHHDDEVTTHDISQGGFSFVFHKNLSKGTHIKACFDMLPNKPVIDGEVRSSCHLYGTQYRIGVCFLDVSRGEEKTEAANDNESERQDEDE